MPVQFTTELPDVSSPSLGNGVEDEISVSWTDITDYGSYRVEYKESSAATWTAHTVVGQATTSTTISGLEDGEEYDVRLRSETEHVTGAWAASTITTAFPGAANPVAHSASTHERVLEWTDNADNEDGFEVQRREAGTATWTTLVDLAPNTTTYNDTDVLAFDSQYEYRIRAYTEDTAATTAVITTSPLNETRSALNWTDFASFTPDGYRVSRSNDGGTSWTQVADLGASTTSYTTVDLIPNPAQTGDWEFQIEAYTAGGSTATKTFSGDLRPPDLVGPYTLVVRLNGQLGHVQGDDCKRVLATLRPTTQSTWEFATGYLAALENWVFGDAFLYGETNSGTFELLVRGELDQVKSEDGRDQTTARGTDVFTKLTTGSTIESYSNIPTDNAIRDYVATHLPEWDWTVDAPNPSQVANNERSQSVDTTSEWNAAVSLAATDPFAVQNGNLELLQTNYVSEAEAPSSEQDPSYVQNSGQMSNGAARGLYLDTSYLKWTVTPLYDIPAENVRISVRWYGADTNIQEWRVVLNGDIVASHAGGANMDNGPTWTHLPGNFQGDGYTGGDLQAGTTYTLTWEATGTTGDSAHWDFVSVNDDRFSYFFDNDNGGSGGYLDGPQLYPLGAAIATAIVDKNYNITAASVAATLDNTTNGQKIEASNTGGDSYDVAAANSSSLSGSFSTFGTLARLQWTLSRYGSRTTATPQTGFQGQKVKSFSLELDGNDRSVIDQQDLAKSDYQNLRHLHKFGDYDWNADYHELDLRAHSFKRGSVLQNASWTRVDDTRDLDVSGYFNAVEVRGKGWSPSSPTPSAYYQDDDEVAAHPQGVVETEPVKDLDLATAADCKSKARTLVAAGTGEDELTGQLDVYSKALRPGYDHEVPVWNNQRATVEEVVFSESNGSAVGALHFEQDPSLVGPLVKMQSALESTKDVL